MGTPEACPIKLRREYSSPKVCPCAEIQGQSQGRPDKSLIFIECQLACWDFLCVVFAARLSTARGRTALIAVDDG
jgi:hypothetical protein